MIKLQRYLEAMEEVSQTSLHQLSTHGIHARIEISIRPGVVNDSQAGGPLLRSKGHMIDLLSHVFAGLFDVLNNRRFKVHLTALSPRTIHSETLFLLRTVHELVKMRSETKFDDIYDSRVHLWLRAVMSLIMTKIGFGHHFKMRFIKEWLLSSNRFDPGGIGHALETNSVIGLKLSPSPPLVSISSGEISSSFLMQALKKELMELGLSHGAINILTDMVKMEEPTHRLIYQQISLLDKLKLAQGLNCFVIPNLTSNYYSSPSTDYFMGSDSNAGYNSIDENPHQFGLHPLHGAMPMSGSGMKTFHLENTSPAMSIIIHLTDFSKLFDPASPTYLLQLFHYIELCHERSMVLPFVGQELNHRPLKPFPDTSNYLKSRYINFTKSSPDPNMLPIFLTDVMSRLGLSYNSDPEHPTISPLLLIKHICQEYLFPCASAQYNLLSNVFPESSHDEFFEASVHQQLSHLNHLVHHSVNEVFVERLPYHDLSVVKYYRSIDQKCVLIKKPQEILKHGDNECTVLNNTGRTNLFHALQEMVNPMTPPDQRKGIRPYLHEFLSRPGFIICDSCLSPTGQNNSSLKGILLLQHLEAKLKFSILENPTSGIIRNYHPDIITPLVALLFKSNILFYDKDSSRTYFHLYNPRYKKIITYKLKGNKMMPLLPCYVLIMNSNIFHSMGWMLPSPRDTQNSTPPDWVFPQASQLIIPTLKKHPLSVFGKLGRAKSIPHCILQLLLLPSVKHTQFQQHDKNGAADLFSLQPFLQELAQLDTPLDSMVDENTISELNSMGIGSITTMMPYLRTDKNITRPEYHKVLCPILCLRYKLWFAVWHESHRRGQGVQKQTHLYCFHPDTEKAATFKLDQFVYIQHMDFIFYLRVLEKNHQLRRCNYWHMKPSNPYQCLSSPQTSEWESDILVNKFSYLDGPIRQCVISNLALSHGRVHLLDMTNATPPEDDSTQPTILTAHILGDSVLGIFPYDIHSGWYPLVLVYSPNDLRNDVEIRETVDQVLSYVLRDSIEKSVHLKTYQYPKVDQLSKTFLQILFGFVLGSSISTIDFNHRVVAIRSESRIEEKTKEFISILAIQPADELKLPVWLRQITELY
jgi:hypothetical protein